MIANAFGLQPNNVDGLRISIGSVVFDFVLARPPSQPLSDSAIATLFGTNATVAELVALYHNVTGDTSAGIVGLSLTPSYFSDSCGSNCMVGILLGSIAGFLALVAVTTVLLLRCRRQQVCWWGAGPCAYWWRCGRRPKSQPHWYAQSPDNMFDAAAGIFDDRASSTAAEDPFAEQSAHQSETASARPPRIPERWRPAPPTAHEPCSRPVQHTVREVQLALETQPCDSSAGVRPSQQPPTAYIPTNTARSPEEHFPFGEELDSPWSDSPPRLSPVFHSTFKSDPHREVPSVDVEESEGGECVIDSDAQDDAHRMGVCLVDDRFALEMQLALRAEQYVSSDVEDDSRDGDGHHDSPTDPDESAPLPDDGGHLLEATTTTTTATTSQLIEGTFGGVEEIGGSSSPQQLVSLRASVVVMPSDHSLIAGDLVEEEDEANSDHVSPAVQASGSHQHLQESSPTVSMRRALYSSWRKVPQPSHRVNDAADAVVVPPLAAIQRPTFRLPPPSGAASVNRSLMFEIARDVSYDEGFASEND
ncbi:transmembrane protein, putative [Bodo saltans]|uniref:Transmembrane protein, putative n=1 Tax=Bodo saltans TaxID=75058 RepID=A0A0S4IVK8_BODSA|nr:transmembrane protein, putative [Bodo saltans]|eukprot:CUG00910.1 transmembrane protein, putative [Bodo saltans]